MSARRVSVKGLVQTACKVIASTVRGLAGERFTGEVYQMYGFSSNPVGEELPRTINIEINGDPDNHVSLPPAGKILANENETEIYMGGTRIRLLKTGEVVIEGEGVIRTDMDVISGGVSLQNHVHTGVQSGGGLSGPPNA